MIQRRKIVRQDLTGQCFGLWSVEQLDVERSETDRLNRTFWLCCCTCGTRRSVWGPNLTSGRSQSCGCTTKRSRLPEHHGHWRTPEYYSWQSMKKRCYDESHVSYSCYGARGITVCAAWRDSFVQFLRDMGPRPSASHTLERRDPAGPYDATNCIWAESEAQQNNKRTTHLLEYQGRCLSIAQWSRLLGLGASTIRERLARGWSVQRALSELPHVGRDKHGAGPCLSRPRAS